MHPLTIPILLLFLSQPPQILTSDITISDGPIPQQNPIYDQPSSPSTQSSAIQKYQIMNKVSKTIFMIIGIILILVEVLCFVQNYRIKNVISFAMIKTAQVSQSKFGEFVAMDKDREVENKQSSKSVHEEVQMASNKDVYNKQEQIENKQKKESPKRRRKRKMDKLHKAQIANNESIQADSGQFRQQI